MKDMRNELNIECPRCSGGYLEDLPDYVWNRNWVIEPKLDGERNTLEITKAGMILIGRNRLSDGLFNCHNDKNPKIVAWLCPGYEGTILDGERTESYTVKGDYDKKTKKRLNNNEFVGYTAWTVLYYKGQDVRNKTYTERRELAQKVIAAIIENNPDANIKLIESWAFTMEKLQELFKQGYEGAVIKKKNVPIPSSKTNPYWFKIKGDNKRTVDAFIIDVIESLTQNKPSGKACTFVVGMLKGASVIKVGHMAGLPLSVQETGLKNFSNYVGRVCEMQISGWDGQAFRWPRFLQWRNDKTKNDCILSEQLGD